MLQSLKLIYQRLIENTKTSHFRALYHSIHLKDRLIGLIGARGVGKTTLLLQLIKNNFNQSEVFYVSADHIYFEQTRLYQFIEDLYLNEGIEVFFIDEIHKYPHWNQELKNLYDGFPQLRIIFSGSSSLDLIKGNFDLSRRAKIYHVPGMSFREYLNFNLDKNIQPVTFNDLVNHTHQLDPLLSTFPKIMGHFQDYYAKGFYPFYFETPLTYYERLLNIIDKTIYEDISNFYNLKTGNLHLFKKILIFLASIPPGNVSTHNIAKNLSVDDKTIMHYLEILNATGLIIMLYPEEKGNQGLRRPEKIFLNNTNLYCALEGKLTAGTELGTVRELFFIQSAINAGLEVFHSKTGDFKISNYIFEIGGPNKTKKQIKNLENSFLVKDNILLGRTRELPLIYFGFLY